ncbi:MAG: hypothetical protein Q8N99_05240 [Nanoarchaeota archaeon]|nr:hypothetical protein [Nanoarchaeota archaeon]
MRAKKKLFGYLTLRKSQIWVETVVYTLIGLTIIAILLSASMPQIDKWKDRSIISQTIESLNILNSKILETEDSPGNIRIANLRIAKGTLEINSSNDLIIYRLDNSRYEMTQTGQTIKEGDILLKTEKYGSRYKLFLILNYSKNVNITYKNSENIKILQAGTTPYKIIIENKGDSPLDKINLNFDIG